MATQLEQAKRLEIEFALYKLNADFCYFLDHRETDRLVELFTDDAIYTHDRRASHGRSAIRALFTRRNASGTRTSRHLQSGLRFEINNTELAHGCSVCMTLVADAPPPITHASPHLVADFVDEYAYCSDGHWRISKRHIERIFVAPGNHGPLGSNRNSLANELPEGQER